MREGRDKTSAMHYMDCFLGGVLPGKMDFKLSPLTG